MSVAVDNDGPHTRSRDDGKRSHMAKQSGKRILGIDNFILHVGNHQLIRAVLEVLKQPGGRQTRSCLGKESGND